VIAAGFDSLRHYNPASTNTYFKPSPAEANSVVTETMPDQPDPPKSSPAGKYKLQHDEVSIEDDLDIPTFLRNKL